MKKINFIDTVLSVVSVIILFSACGKDENLPFKTSNKNIVSINEAKEIADGFIENQTNVILRSGWEGQSATFNGQNDLPGLHVFNYVNGEDKSFVIIAGDNRISPILAHGNEDFPLDSLPFGVAEWMHKNIDFVDSIRGTNIIQSIFIKELWERRILPMGYDCCEECPNWPDCRYEPVGCGNETIICNGVTNTNPCGDSNYYQYGPLLDTRWGQGCVYNELCPEEPILPLGGGIPVCGGTLPCDHFHSGCVATAMAQVINYFEHPSNYNYASLLPIYYPWDFGASGAVEVANLMYDAAESVDMEWGCSGSGAQTGDVDNALENNFGYSDGGYFDDYGNSGPIKQNIRWSKPVIFAGCSDGISLFDWTYDDCHAWVCDGYKGWSNLCYSYLYYNMNWGWNGSYNGWYGVSNWAPGSYNFKYQRRVLYNINP